jgi:hypothetical protein
MPTDLTPTPIGPEFRVNTYTENSQYTSSVAALADGGFVVTWASNGQDGSGWGVYAQRYGADGQPIGPEFRVNTYTESSQYTPSVAALADGGFVATWTSIGQDGSEGGIYAQYFGADGQPVGAEVRVNTHIGSPQSVPSVAALADGGFVATWQSWTQDGFGEGVYAQRYGTDGQPVGGEFRVNTQIGGEQYDSSVAALADGGFVVTWTSLMVWISWGGQNSSRHDVYAQRYNADGQPIGGEFRVNTYTDSEQHAPSVAALAGSGFVVTWHSQSQDGSDYGVYAQRYGADGQPVGGEFRVNTQTGNGQYAPSVAALAGGGFVVTWHSQGQDSSELDVHAQRYGADGQPVGGEFRVNTHIDSYQESPAVAALADGSIVVTWTSYAGQDGSVLGVYAQRFELPSANPLPTTGTTLEGGPWGNSTLAGTDGPDSITAHGWNNHIEAGAGDDTINGGEGNAWIDAGAGYNTVTVGGWSNTILAGDGGTKLTGPQGNTTVRFGSGNHVVQLGGSSNLVELGIGNSVVEVGEGNSTVRIAGGDNTVTLGGWGNRITTGDGADVIVAGAGTAIVDAGGGDDHIGLAGWGNHVRAGDGNDVVLLAAADGDGSIDGGTGTDTLVLPGTVGEYRFGEAPDRAIYVSGPGSKSYQLTNLEFLAFGGGTAGDPAALSVVLAKAGLEELAAKTADGASSLVLPDLYKGPVEYLRYQLLGSESGEALRATASADFVNLLGGDDAADTGAGDDVVDGGLGSNFITGGAGRDVFFLDGRGGGATWSTITDWEAGEQLSVWGWRPGISQTLWADNEGVQGWKGATLHIDFDGNGSWDASVTWSGIARSQLPTPREYEGLLWFA